MGASNTRKRGGSRYYGIFEGHVTIPSTDKEHPNYHERTSSEGNSKQELWFDRLDGILRRVLIQKPETGSKYGAKLKLVMQDEEGLFTFEMTRKSGYANNLLNKLIHLDASREIGLEPYYIEKNNNVSTYMGVFYGEEKVPPFFYKDNMNGVPEPTQTPEGDWDWNAQTKAVYELLEKKLFPQLGQKHWDAAHESNEWKKLVELYDNSEPVQEANPTITEAQVEAESAKQQIVEESKGILEEEDDLPF